MNAIPFIGESTHVKSLKDLIQTISHSFGKENDPVVLITGEEGSGKDLLARYLHQMILGPHKPFAVLNCAKDSLSEESLKTFSETTQGTIYLNEVGDLSLKIQTWLFEWLQSNEKKSRAHIMASTSRDLSRFVSENKFREDLYFRMNTFPLSLAPLRSRTEDISVLANYFLESFCKDRKKKFSGISVSALRALENYRWPGNIRELKYVIERAALIEKGPQLEISGFRQETLYISARGNDDQSEKPTAQIIHFPQNVNLEMGLAAVRKEMDEKLVRQILVRSLTQEKGNVSAIARSLKLDRANLLRLLKRFGIDPALFRTSSVQVSEVALGGELRRAG